MKFTEVFGRMGMIGLATLSFAGQVGAAPVLCEDVNKNHMYVDSSYVSACLDAGVGNIGNEGNNNDAFTSGSSGSGWVDIGDAGWTQNGSSGTFSLDSSLWSSWGDLAIGFKFGTGNEADEWFVYSLQQGVTSGYWSFVNVFERGGGLSHAVVYGSTPVPEPSVLALMGLGLLGLVAGRRLKQSKYGC